MGQKLINELGNTYGALTVIDITKDKNNRTAWICLCKCGNTKIVRGPDLRKGRITSCGCRMESRQKRIKDISGKTYGYLKVLERDDEHYDYINKQNVYKCLCMKCNTICYIPRGSLISGHNRSCGCAQKELIARALTKNEIGNTYGELTVIELIEHEGKLQWKCLCSCGNITYVSGACLRSGNTRSCGCKKGYFSHEVKAIEDFLRKEEISYQTEYSFSDLIGDYRPLRFDFVLLKDKKVMCCIEYNGEQHYKPIEYFGGKENFLKQQRYDKRKEEYCTQMQIPLIILPYSNTHEQNIQIISEFVKRW